MRNQLQCMVNVKSINKLFQHSDELMHKARQLSLLMDIQSKKLQQLLVSTDQFCRDFNQRIHKL